MKDKFIKKLKRSWLAIWIAFAAAALSTIGVLAAYTSVSSVKRVVSTQKGAGMLFSSNYLTTDENDLPRTITFSSMENSPCVTVNVCNYPQTLIKHNDKDITYTLTVELVESTGVKEGILFLDEINCVSETLAPAMLQFLQYKIFGRHRVPGGWIVVTAGNPPEYNNSVREFDIVTWDQLKRIDVEPDYEAWKEYASRKRTHPAILTYLDILKLPCSMARTTAFIPPAINSAW